MDKLSNAFFRRCAATVAAALAATAHAAGPPTNDLIARGAYLAAAGDCAACHTEKNGAPLAGGLSMDTPFGPLISPQHHARQSDGHRQLERRRVLSGDARRPRQGRLVPVPRDAVSPGTPRSRATTRWPSRRTCSRCPPSNKPRAASHLRFPVQRAVRRSAHGARRSSSQGTFQPDPAGVRPGQSRGSYLVTGLAHCGECHNGQLLAGSSKFDESAARRHDRSLVCAQHHLRRARRHRRLVATGSRAVPEDGQRAGQGRWPSGPMAETVHSLSQLDRCGPRRDRGLSQVHAARRESGARTRRRCRVDEPRRAGLS